MKVFFSLFLIVFSLSAAALAQASPPSAGTSPGSTSQPLPTDQQSALKARALLDQMIQALGGQAYLNIQDISQEGRTYSFHLGRPNSAGTMFWRFYKFPDKDRVELTKKRDVIEIFNGNKGYEITYKGTRPNDDKELADYLRRRHYGLDWVLRSWLSEPGVALFYEGQTVADQKSAEQITIMNSKNEAVTLYIDLNTHLPVKKSFSWRDPTDKQRNVEDEIYDNYRPIQGVMTPFDVTRYYNGDMSNQRFMTSVSFNKGLNDTLFEANPSNTSKK
ncbi:MAG TPA: hypothetical protein VFA74_09930 [Terriglobales bacterium]|nr:hypothetical protein [Terriglobales bacterium]